MNDDLKPLGRDYKTSFAPAIVLDIGHPSGARAICERLQGAIKASRADKENLPTAVFLDRNRVIVVLHPKWETDPEREKELQRTLHWITESHIRELGIELFIPGDEDPDSDDD